ncbi:MAG: sodium:solute symporter family protein [Gemmatimonadota bacterium]|nr:sodium:solute symporter family protein [Gemmatimonadota bacterium]
MTPVLTGVLVYILLQLALGFWVSRRVKTEDDYLVAGRRLGFPIVMFTVFATWFGAETCIGSAGEAYRAGLSGTTADPFGYAGCLLFMALVYAVPLWKRKLTTLADLFRQRYGQGVERLAVLLLVPTSLMWAAAQIRAFGHVLGAASNFSIEFTVTIAAVVVIVYTVAGGLLADAITDFVQGVVLIIGLALVAGLMFASGDFAVIRELPAEQLSLRAPDATWLATLEAWAIPIMGSVVAQELVQRVIAAKSPQVAQRATISAALLYFAVGTIPLMVGLAAIRLAPGITEPEQVLILRAEHYLPGILYVVFAGALVSAILSTVDSALLVSGSLLAHNVVLPVLPHATERTKLTVNRAAVATFGLLAYVLALSAPSVYGLVEQASAFGGASVFVAMTFGLFSRIGGARSATGSVVAGVGVYTVGTYGMDLPYPFLSSLVASGLVYLGVSVFERGPSLDSAEAA